MSTPRFEVRQLDPSRSRRRWIFVVLAWLGSLVLASVLAVGLARKSAESAEPVDWRSESVEVDALKSRIAVLERSEQVAKAALVDLQRTLRDREEEIAGIRLDLAFYGRLVGGARREGLTIHSLTLSAVPDSRAWNFTATLTQNFKRAGETRGRFMLGVSGISDGKLVTLTWSELAQQPSNSGIAYAFKYFQQINGTIMLPEGFEPNRVRAIAEGDGGKAEQELPWIDAAKAEETADVR